MMAVSSERFLTGEKAAVTDGRVKVTFDTPSDLADWVADVPAADLAKLQWCKP
jgi:hypothetical protein